MLIRYLTCLNIDQMYVLTVYINYMLIVYITCILLVYINRNLSSRVTPAQIFSA